MSKRTTIVLGVIAVAMAAFIAFVESGMLSTGELAGRRGRVLERFVRPRVTDVALSRGDTRVVLHRDREEDLDEFEVGHWVLTEPVATDADEDAVDQLLSSLEWLEARRTLEGIGAEDRERFGLSEPRASVRFTVAGQDVTVSVGGDDPRGEGVYVGVSDRPDRAFVVGRDFVEALEHDASHFRKKELVGALRSADVSAVVFTRRDEGASEARIRIERGEQGWRLREPEEALARTPAVEELFSMVRDVRAERFLAERAEALAQYGLDTPAREVVIERGRADAEGDRTPLRLRVGGACPGHEGERTAMAGEGPIVCVSAQALDALELDAPHFRENRLLAVRDDEIERIEIDGVDDFTLRRDDAGWKLARGEAESAADEDAIADWTAALRAQEASAYERATDEALRARGLATPAATITLVRSAEDRREQIAIGASDAEGVWVRRGDDPQIARFPSAAIELVRPAAMRFRDRRLVRDAEANARRLRIVRADGEEVVEKDGSEWQVTAPLDLPADRVVARDVARAIASLAAVRFVSEVPAPEHGLERPRITLTATFEGALPEADEGESDEHDHDHGEADETPPREIVLRVGARTEGGAFARLGDDLAVFVIASDLVDDLEGPLVSRDLLATETSELESLAIVRGGERVELRREGSGWSAGQGPADEARTTLILDRLASMRAVGTTRYGEPPADAGFGSPAVVLEIQRRAGSPERYELAMGAPGAAGDDGWYHARRSDLAVGFRLGAPVVRAFLEYQP